MAFAVVNYPTLSESDFTWIQHIRKKHDRLFYRIVDPHITFVFPTENIELDTFTNHIKSVSSKFNSFTFVCRCVTIGDPDFWEHAHVFMIPDEGFSTIVKLHDAFYRGILEKELRLDLPFVPHIGVASYPSPEQCKKVVDGLNQRDFQIIGKVQSLDIIEFDGESTKTIDQIEL
ncbi:MAG: 2'-5' RNA ligase family protein [Cyclobacteriaceae bacterium]|nr:2'-5' RNA ligase family protein [Cyclobacteriaceae bacterium]